MIRWRRPATSSQARRKAFETLEHGGEHPAIRVTDAQGRSCVYVPIREDGQVVKSFGFQLIRIEQTPTD